MYFWLLVATVVVLLWSIVVGVRCHQALDISTQLSWKVYLINVMVGIIWIVLSAIWLLAIFFSTILSLRNGAIKFIMHVM